MKIFRKIDTTTGNFLEDVLFETHPVLEDGELDPQYIEEAPKQGFFWPKWNGTEWAEGGQAPEPTPQGPTVEERLQMAEDTIMFMLMGSMQSGLWIKKRPD